MQFDAKRVVEVLWLWLTFIVIGLCVGFYFR
jgi:hypothetical protein